MRRWRVSKYGSPSGRVEQCQRCHLDLDVDELGRVPQHRRRTGIAWDAGVDYSYISTEMCPKSGHPSREEIQRRKESRCDQRLATAIIARDEARVALDAVIERRDEYADRVPEWCRAALAVYNQRHGSRHAHAYEYATKVAVASRRANTRGDIYCRYCGERLAVGVKDPHRVVASSFEAQRHLTICALQVLAGMREPAKPGYRTLPMEYAWVDEEAVR